MFKKTLHSFRDATLRYAKKIQLQFNNRVRTTQQELVPQEALDKYQQLITIERDGKGTITHIFQQAIDAADNAASNRAQAHMPNHRRQG